MSRFFRPCWILNRHWPAQKPEPESSQKAQRILSLPWRSLAVSMLRLFPSPLFERVRLAIPLVKALTEQVRKTNVEAARFVHWGATSQDVVDSAMSLLLKRAEPILIVDLLRIEKALAGLSDRHKHSVMLGRTLLQPAPPVTFGLKAAGWLVPVRRGRRRLQNGFRDAAVLQFGGATGTLAALGDRGIAVLEALSVELAFRILPARPGTRSAIDWRRWSVPVEC